MSTAYLFAHVDTSTMTIDYVRIMSDSCPTRHGCNEAWLEITKVRGESFGEAMEALETMLEEGGTLYSQWYGIWEKTLMRKQYEEGMAQRAAERAERELHAFWFQSYDVSEARG